MAQVLPGGMVAGYFQGTGSASEYAVTIRAVNDPGITPYFWAQQFWIDTSIDHGGYFGLQANGVVGDGTQGRLLIFSIWNALEAKPAPGANAVNFGGEGVGWSLRRKHAWRAGVAYRFRLTRQNDVWWSVTVSAPGQADMPLGSIRVTVKAPLRASFVTFTEYYLSLPACMNVPYAHVVFEDSTYGTAKATALQPTTYGNCKSNAQGYLIGTNALAQRTGIARSTAAAKPDYNGDGHSDILWRSTTSGANSIWLSGNANTRLAMASVANPAWKIIGTGDFDGNGRSDVLWRNSSSLANTIWKSANSATPQAVATVTNPAWQIVGIGDFDGDLRSDLVWRNAVSGANAIWKGANQATPLPISAVTNTAWRVIGVGDFDGDGRSDLLWRNSTTLATTIWKSANSASLQSVTAMTNRDWAIAGIGDFDGDGRSDLLWRNSRTLASTIWKAANSTTQQAMVSVTDPAWKIAGIGDFDGGGRSDVLWRHTVVGTNSIWRSANYATRYSIGSAGTAWQAYF